MQGTQNSNGTNPLVREVVDLDALFAERSLAPAPLKVGGKTYEVRTDLTTAEVNEFLAAYRGGKEVEAFAILVGKRDAVTLDKTLAKLPLEHHAIASAQLLRASRALAQFAVSDEHIQQTYGVPGESKAS